MLSSIKSKIDNLDNIVKLIDWFPTKIGTALVFELVDISLHDYLSNINEPIPLADFRAIIKQVYEHSTVRCEAKHCKLCQLQTFLLTFVLSDGHRNWWAEREWGDPRWSPPPEHNDGESPNTNLHIQADRLRWGLSYIRSHTRHAFATTTYCVRWIICIITLVWVSSWPVLSLFYVLPFPLICGPWAVWCLRWSTAMHCSKEPVSETVSHQDILSLTCISSVVVFIQLVLQFPSHMYNSGYPRGLKNLKKS